METAHLDNLRAQIQHNCHIADARHAGDYTLCVYLLKMREFYRWEHGRGFAEELPGEAVGRWLREREALWESLEEEEYRPLELDGTLLEPFDSEAVNALLLPAGLVYSGGLGCKCRPHFFLGELLEERRTDEYRLLVAGRELARDLTAPPAMSLGDTIFIRRESLRRMLWERTEEARWSPGETPMKRAIAGYGFEQDVEQALEQMTEDMSEQLVAHEIGEIRAGHALGQAWPELVASLPRSKSEILLRAIRDHLADALSTLPDLLERGLPPAETHFYMANLNGMRRQLFPSLVSAYERWLQDGDARPMREAVAPAAEHWLESAQSALDAWHTGGHDGLKAIQDTLAERTL
ncbi:MAG: hypothetical protein D6717_04490 [Gammaproteobacteria bacterium]|nr:MAG: hypothetical protein D6717_04490 [Gammaproteobacteria bacterium]